MKLSIATTHQENLLGFIYLAFSQLLLPDLIAIVAYYLGFPISLATLNIIFFLVNFFSIVAIFHRFLGSSLQKAWKNFPKCLLYVFIGFGIYYWASILFALLITWLNPNFANVNDQTIAGIAQEQPGLMVFATVFLVPVVEETLYRGLVFQNLQRKHRIAAYAVSAAVFSAIHIIGYIGSTDWATLALCFVQYLPAGIAFAWAYEKSDTIVTPILIHIIINQIGMSAMR